ncbi:MAG: hypothetical protein A2Y79_10070 [Deltaproteobacteria bacterium RBG_13_43_22]|nr:MAG: hypothetical protein A2Y79_10070 [Deltaproteobacteria bacterium RBG_13_43_22]
MGTFLSQVAGAEEWELKTCLEIGLKQNPTIRGAMKGVEGAEARVKQNQADYYPDLFAETDYTRYKGSFSSGTSSGAMDRDLYNYYIGLSQNIYDFGRREYKIQASRNDLGTYQWTLKDTRLTVIDTIRQTYYGVLLAQRVVKVRQEDLNRTREHFKQAQGFYQVGLKAKIDVTQAEVAVITAQKALLQAENNVQISRVALAAAMGLDKPPVYSLRDDLDTNRVSWQLEDLKKEALENHPGLNRLRASIQYYQSYEKWAQKEFWPKLTGTARYGWSGSDLPANETWNVGLQLNFPFFSGFESQAKLAEIRAALEQAKANLATQILQVTSDLQSQYLNLQLAEKQIDVAREALRSANENLDLAEGRYKAGVGNMLDVTDARSSFFQAETDYNQALYNYITARYKVDKVIGRE